MDYTSQWGSDRHVQRGKELVAGIFRDKLFYKRESPMRKPRHREVRVYPRSNSWSAEKQLLPGSGGPEPTRGGKRD